MSAPSRLDEVLGSLETDNEFLLTGDVFNREPAESWVDYKRRYELEPARMQSHRYGFHLHHDLYAPNQVAASRSQRR